ncbi:hypothetical protein JOB18_048053 [Solea senegalensis]|uniref:Uncharacterized protein n=1 Tax=Solea senegalensis TaxID=28829 RepID=A0AAV6QF66_SOLSE|nr:hypothetical protein JOB18_048053 [Solea senegalensis]
MGDGQHNGRNCPSFHILFPIGRVPPANQLNNETIAFLEHYVRAIGNEEQFRGLMIHFHNVHQQQVEMQFRLQQRLNGHRL